MGKAANAAFLFCHFVIFHLSFVIFFVQKRTFFCVCQKKALPLHVERANNKQATSPCFATWEVLMEKGSI